MRDENSLLDFLADFFMFLLTMGIIAVCVAMLLRYLETSL